MYCTNCGKEYKGDKFCSRCGKELDRDIYHEEDEKINSNKKLNEDIIRDDCEHKKNYKVKEHRNFEEILSENIDLYCKEYLGSKKGMTLERYLNAANLLPRMRITSFLIPIVLLSIPFTILGGFLMGGCLGLFIYVFRCSRILRKENTLQTKCNYDVNKIKMVYDYMLNNNKINDLIIDSYDEQGINIIYKDQTHHKVKFFKNEGMYIVYCGRCTKRQYIKSGFQHSSAIMMRNSVLINPILRTYSKYAIN